MIAPCPGSSRGTDAVVPSVPGLVSETVVPSKSESFSLPERARPDHVLRGGHELGEAHGVGVRNVGDEEGARAVRLRHVDGETEADGASTHADRLGAGAVVGVVQSGKRLQGLDDRPGEELREGDLRRAPPRPVPR